MGSVFRATTPQQIAAVQELMREYLLWVSEQFPGTLPTRDVWETELKSLPGIYAPPLGGLFLAIVEDQPSGCAALKPKDETTAELKRMYVRPAFRGQRIGWLLGQKVLHEARAMGYKKVYLDSDAAMKSAHKVYERLGFKNIPAPADYPKELISVSIFMECDLQVRL